MKHLAVFSLAVSFVACCWPVYVRAAEPNVRPCSGGLQPDGVLNWSKLPTAAPGVALNSTIPVTGVPGLTATVQIPVSTTAEAATYSVFSPSDMNVAVSSTVTLSFSKPVRGVSTSLNFFGRFSRLGIMDAYVSLGDIGSLPPVAEVTASAFDHPSTGDIANIPLQIRSESANIGAVVITFPATPDFNTYDVSNLRIESGSSPDPSKQVPTAGLKQWLRADSVYDPFSGQPAFLSWPDQSGNHADATGTVLSVPDGPNCAAVVKFDGRASLPANLPIAGWTGMTVFLVSQASADAPGWSTNQPLLWKETALWGTTFVSPSQTNAYFRFGTTQVGNQPTYARPVDVGADYTLTTAVHNGTVDQLYLNGVLALQQGGKSASLAGVSSNEMIGAGLNNTFFTGAIGEILVYDRALTDNERTIVERYLSKKFGIF